MHNALTTLAKHGDTILQVLAAFLIAFLTNALTNRARDRQDRAGDLATLQAQVDAFITAAAVVRAAARTSDTIWEGPREKLRATAIVILGSIGGWAIAEASGRSDNWRYVAGLRDAAQLLSREVHARKTALASVQASTVQLGTAAVPLIRHHDQRLVHAVQAVMEAAGSINNSQRFEEALRAFGQAANAALQPPPSVWARMLRRA
ncbi:hypothetical protein AB0M19_11010 [Streptomyces sp. NPDC051920]|uniref:hypothetical protein n=1 Tax=Streptomyces sp. NPDC051920 TaxID=3155523 RepID=UPI00343A61BA